MSSNANMGVVIGTGPLGLAVVRELLAKGKKVHVVNRTGKAEAPANVEVKAGDICNLEFARAACQSAGSIYLCAKPPYTEWVDKFEPIMDGAIEAAAATGAKLIYGDNLYAYGPFTGAVTEDFPHAATGPKGRVRAQLAEKLMAAHKDGKVRAAIGCASDFYGPGVTESSLGERVFGFALAGKAASVLGNPDASHTYTFIDDFAKGLVTLGEHAEALGQTWHIPSAETITTREFIALVSKELGQLIKIQAAPRWLITVLGVFDPMMHELPEMMFQSERPFVVDHSKFERAFGAHPTPHPEAIRMTLDWYHQKKG